MSLSIERLSGGASGFAGLTFGQFAGLLSGIGPTIVAVGARMDGEPVGLALGEVLEGHPRDPGREVYLMSLLVLGRARRRGIGVALLRMLEAEAGRRGAERLRTRHGDFIPGRVPFEATLRCAGWEAPEMIQIRFHWEAGPASTKASAWKSLSGRLLRSSLYRCDPWRSLDAADEAAVARLMAQENYHPDMDYPRFAPLADPAVSLILRRGDMMVGWIIGEKMAVPMKQYAGKTVVYYHSAYVDEALWRTGFLIAGYWVACTKQQEAYGAKSIGIFDTNMPRNQMVVMRRLSEIGFRVDEVYETRKGIMSGAVTFDGIGSSESGARNEASGSRDPGGGVGAAEPGTTAPQPTDRFGASL